jgi:hypothetical protein
VGLLEIGVLPAEAATCSEERGGPGGGCWPGAHIRGLCHGAEKRALHVKREWTSRTDRENEHVYR